MLAGATHQLVDVIVKRRVVVDVGVGEVDEVVDVGPHVVLVLHVLVEAVAMVLEVVARQATDEAAVAHVLLGAPLKAWSRV